MLGKPAGFLVTFLDIFKGFIVVFLPLWLPVHADGAISTFFTNGLIVGAFAILGHVYPIYLGFKGGKAVATVRCDTWNQPSITHFSSDFLWHTLFNKVCITFEYHSINLLCYRCAVNS